MSHRLRRRRLGWLTAIVLVAVAAAALAVALSLQGGGHSSSAPAPPTSPAAAPSTTSPPPPTTRPAGGAPTTAATGPAPTSTRVLVEQFGQGDGSVGPFDASGPWTLSWTYDCSASGGHGSFSVLVASPSASWPPVRSAGVHATGQASYPAGQALRLSVQTTCAWTVRAAPSPG